MNKKFFKLLTVGTLAGGIILSSTPAFAQTRNIENPIKIEKPILLAKKASLKDGRYSVSARVLKEKKNEMSMAGQYVGQRVNLDIKNGSIYASVDITRIDWMKNINILVNGSSVKYTTQKKGKQGATLKFKVPSINPSIKFNMNVVPMGNAGVAFRVVTGNDIKMVKGQAQTKKNSSNKKSIKKKNEVKKNYKLQKGRKVKR